MPGIGFGKRPKPRKFDFIPRFYDPRKEELQERIGHYNEEISDEEKAKHRIRSGIRNRYYGDQKYRSDEVKKSNFRLLFIIIILCFITYLILKSDRLLKMLETFS